MAKNPKDEIINRLKRIEGQIRGLQRLIEEDRDCADIVQQLSAARKALDKVGFLILSHRMQECVNKKSEGNPDKAMQEALDLFLMLA